jgi:hypothetical protein
MAIDGVHHGHPSRRLLSDSPYATALATLVTRTVNRRPCPGAGAIDELLGWLCYTGHLLMEHRSALIVDAELTAAPGSAEGDCAVEMLGRLQKHQRRRTVAGDKGYDTGDFVSRSRELGFTPHVAPNTTNRRSAIDRRTTRHRGHAQSQRVRKRFEKPFGWIKTSAGGRKLRYIGHARDRA